MAFKIYNYWFIVGLLVAVISFIPQLGTFDFVIHDTYYVGATFDLSLLFFFFAIVYWILGRITVRLNNWLSFAHIVFTSFSFILLFFYIALSNTEPSFSLRRFGYFNDYAQLFFLIGQFLFILHLLALIVRFLREKITHIP
jgi:hypothetical protein